MNKPASSSIFTNPPQTDVLWHDIKKYTTIGRMYVENFEDGIYGEISPSMIAFTQKMRAVNAESLIYIENVMLLQKITLGVFEAPAEKISTASLFEGVNNAIAPLLTDKKIILESPTDTLELSGNPRYLKQFLVNIIYLLVLESLEITEISTKISKEKERLMFSISHNAQSTLLLPTAIAGEQIFSKEAQNAQEQHALFWYNTLYLRDLFLIDVTSSEHTITISI